MSTLLQKSVLRATRAQPIFGSVPTRGFAKRYFKVNYRYKEDAYYKRIPMREEHQKQLEKLKEGDTKIIAAPHFPYEENTMIIEHETREEDGGFEQVKKFVDNDPYVKKEIVESYTIREFELRGAITEFDRLSRRYVLRS